VEGSRLFYVVPYIYFTCTIPSFNTPLPHLNTLSPNVFSILPRSSTTLRSITTLSVILIYQKTLSQSLTPAAPPCLTSSWRGYLSPLRQSTPPLSQQLVHHANDQMQAYSGSSKPRRCRSGFPSHRRYTSLPLSSLGMFPY